MGLGLLFRAKVRAGDRARVSVGVRVRAGYPIPT